MDIEQKDYTELRTNFNNVLNCDKSTFKTSNDEPTPIECIEEMLSVLPKDVWLNKDLKVLDPCCGNGNFSLVVWNILKGLGYKDKEIVENHLYFNDINQERLANVHTTFCGDKFNINIENEDFLKMKYDNLFDIIVGNPPYAKLLENGKRASKNHNLIKDFLDKSLTLLKPGGYLVYITPDNWMSYADRNEIIKKLTKLQIVHLNIHTAKKYFKKIGSSFTWYIIENTPHYKDICVEGLYKGVNYKSNVVSQTRRYIPLFYSDVVQSILSKTIDNDIINKYAVETTSDLHKYTKKDLISCTQDEEYKYRLIHTPKQTVYAKRPHKYQSGYKVFLSTTDKYKIFVDNCGMTQSIAFIRCASVDEAEEVKKVLTHPLYEFINNICRWGNFNNIRILQQFPIPQDIEDIYGSFGITDKEKEVILSYL